MWARSVVKHLYKTVVLILSTENVFRGADCHQCLSDQGEPWYASRAMSLLLGTCDSALCSATGAASTDGGTIKQHRT
jgi:hypothetical protein